MRPWLPAAVLAASVALAYLPALSSPLLLDDPHVLRSAAAGAGQILRESGDLANRPLSRWMMAAEREAHPEAFRDETLARMGFRDPAVFAPLRARSVLLHLLCAASLWALSRRMGLSAGGSLLAAALFAAHPLCVGAAAYLAQGALLLSAAFGTLSALCFLRAGDRAEACLPAIGAFCGAWAAAAAAALSHPVGALAPAFWLAASSPRGAGWRRIDSTRINRHLARIAVGLVLLWGAGKAGLDRKGLREREPTRTDYLFGRNLGTIPLGAGLAVLPSGLRLDYDLRGGPWRGDLALPAFAGAAVLAAWAWGAWRSGGAVRAGLLWWLVACAPAALFPLAEPFFEHRLYPGLAGGALAAAAALDGMAGALRRGMRLCAAALVALLWIGAASRGMEWRSPRAVWAGSARHSPRKASVHVNLANCERLSGRIAQARAGWRRALAADPANAAARENLRRSEATVR